MISFLARLQNYDIIYDIIIWYDILSYIIKQFDIIRVLAFLARLIIYEIIYEIEFFLGNHSQYQELVISMAVYMHFCLLILCYCV